MSIHFDYTVYITDLPREMIEDCSRGGMDATTELEYWIKKLGITVNQEKAKNLLRGIGAWDDLETVSEEEITKRTMWITCGDFSEFLCYCDDAGIDPWSKEGIPDEFSSDSGSSSVFFEG